MTDLLYLEQTLAGYLTAAPLRAHVAHLVGRLHAFTPVPTVTPRWEPADHAEPTSDLMHSLDTPWLEGPYGEVARTLVTRSAAGIRKLLHHYEWLLDRLMTADDPWVVTHGEPHAGDVLVLAPGDMRLIDWDDACLAPRERDLRILLHGNHHTAIGWDNRDVLAAYHHAAGPVQPRQFVLELFRAEWALAAIRGSQLFRQPHHETADTAARWQHLNIYLPVEQNWPNLH